MKLACECGASIVDQTDALPYKAYLLPDQEASAFSNRLEALLDGLVGLDGKRGANVMVQIVPTRERLQRELMRLWVESFRIVYQCSECGRLNVEGLGGGRDWWFLPEEVETPTTLLQSVSGRSPGGA